MKAVTGITVKSPTLDACKLIDNHSHLYLDSHRVDSASAFDAMYVCVCHAISDRQIREVVDRGAGSL